MAFLGLLTLFGLSSAGEPRPHPPTPPRADEFVVVPLRVHVLRADDPVVDCKLSDDDIQRIIRKVNDVWRPAGVYFGLESIVREPAANVGRFRALREQIGAAPLRLYPLLVPEATRSFRGLHVYYVHRLPVNGVYMGADFAFVQETAKLREVEGGIDEPVPRVTAHELGHALGLVHRQDGTNLMASGTTGTLLNGSEAETARAGAKRTEGAMTVAQSRQAAEEAAKSGDHSSARRLGEWVNAVSPPGRD